MRKKFHNSSRILLLAFLFLACIILPGCREKKEDVFSFPDGDVWQEEEESIAGETGMAGQETAQTETAPFYVEEAPVCVVHICGAVRQPGVYELPAGSRIMDAVTAGGGFLPEADQAACNLARKVEDGCQIYIMTLEESRQRTDDAGPLAESDAAAQAEREGKVNLNTADAATLKTLPGIGDSRAAAILSWREENGRFESIEDIMKVSGIKEAAFAKIKDRITVG